MNKVPRLVPGVDYYLDPDGKFVLTESFLRRRCTVPTYLVKVSGLPPNPMLTRPASAPLKTLASPTKTRASTSSSLPVFFITYPWLSAPTG